MIRGSAPTVLVVGAGINGAALARELVLAGCDVIVTDDHDIAAGTTAWSTRLVHGGLRYLEYGEFGLVRESLAERGRLVRLAPHLVAPLRFYLPVQGRLGGLASAAARFVGLETLARRLRSARGRGSIATGIGLALYDLLAADRGWPWHRAVRPGAAGLPAVDRRRFPRAQTYVDAQLTYPERLTVELLVDAAAAAAERGRMLDVRTRCRVVAVNAGAAVLRGDDGAETERRIDAVANVTGAWVDRTLADGLHGLAADDAPLVGGTKGSHLVVDHAPLREALAGMGVYAEAADGRPVFVLPFGPRAVLVGTTDLPWRGDPWRARAEPEEITYLLESVARLFPAVAPGPEAVVQHYCGVRPLPATGATSPAGITRRHLLVRHPAAPLPAWSVVGGKLTTCRSLAESAARTILAALSRPVAGTSRRRPLPGATEGAERAALVARTAAAAAAVGVAPDDREAAAVATVDLFGALAPAALGEGLVEGPAILPGSPLPATVVRYCVRREWARSLADIVERRLMLLFAIPLRRSTLAGIAAVMEADGVLPRGGAADEVARLVASLAERYDKRVD
ncbi:MAG: FAD-dependent oxidoreductase [Planctomycetaceae bacterium]